ncbi:hypothetical protein OF897_18415 [Chryseobacterium formosus]|uniref:Uncharacterized protein n=1 Tax=Chryseobacterium formosus TaxID=1537363 RepID=A0ABT3XW85_9FLAO|nr:hypothetical protein [Chryseobacterium formosus]MCX8525892.1 hypothetical protein [Chryseobacterium formosus]
METNIKYNNFIEDIKANNISSNISFLKTITQLIKDDLSKMQNDNVIKLREIIDMINKLDDKQIIDEYISFGYYLKSILTKSFISENKEILKKITIQYLEIAKWTKDTRIKNLGFDIAKELTS